MDRNITNKLTKLHELQAVDICLDGIVKLRGTLPEEVAILEQNVQNISSKIEEHKESLARLEQEVIDKKAFIKRTEKTVQQYEAQQMEVRNNREYDALTKELELQRLNIQLANKSLHTAYAKIEQDKGTIDELHTSLSVKNAEQLLKQEELTTILKATILEDQDLMAKRQEIISFLGEPLYLAYERIRQNVSNNLAVASIEKGACGGCCIVIPPQQKLVVYEHNKIVFCEHCGRMLIATNDVIIPTV